MDAAWFKNLQKRAGLTSFDLGAAIGRDRTAISKIINGKQPITLEQARVFAELLGVPLAEMVERSGLAGKAEAQQIAPGFAESGAVPYVPGSSGRGDAATFHALAQALGAGQAGVDIWQVKGFAMALGGYLDGDYLLVDTHASERVRGGDVVIAQVYNNATASAATLLRRFEPPVLVAASTDPADARVHVVDGINVVIFGKITASWRL